MRRLQGGQSRTGLQDGGGARERHLHQCAACACAVAALPGWGTAPPAGATERTCVCWHPPAHARPPSWLADGAAVLPCAPAKQAKGVAPAPSLGARSSAQGAHAKGAHACARQARTDAPSWANHCKRSTSHRFCFRARQPGVKIFTASRGRPPMRHARPSVDS
ncbi:MAG: hypothetical protein J3K34DRAFT_403686 [Monoraphidium minutum]|nr:MAG: hypothetical protein J3K34DRAFT_403686 [Monoraphidium minutum]